MRKLRIEELNRISIEEFRDSGKIPLVVILDNIRSLNNIGSVFRTCDAFRVQKIFLCGITATPPHKDIHKTALGATESMEWEYSRSSIDVVKQLKSEGYRILSVEQTEKSTMLEKLEMNNRNRYALVFGHEIRGVEQEVINESELSIEIPQYGTKHSLNVSVSAGIVIWEAFKHLSGKLGL